MRWPGTSVVRQCARPLPGATTSFEYVPEEFPVKALSVSSLSLRLAMLASALALAGCGAMMKTPYTAPEVAMPGQWQAPAVPAQQAMSAYPWWHRFNDPALNALVGEALRTNNDLAAATIRVRRAQLIAGLAQSDQYP